MAERDADVIVIGAGPAGIAAACHASASARVLLLDAAPHAGGQIWRHRDPSDLPSTARRWLARFAASPATFLPESTVTDVKPGLVAITQGGRGRLLRTGAIILATGARERYLPFPGWTLPGVLGVGGLQALIKGGADVRGFRIAVAGSGPLLLPVAATAARAGASVVLIAEQASRARVRRFAAGLWQSPGKLRDAARYRLATRRTPYLTDAWVARVIQDAGALRVEIRTAAGTRTVAADLVATGYGLVPSTELAELAGCRTDGGAAVVNACQETSVSGVFAAGEVTGIGGADAAILEGTVAGITAARGSRTASAVIAARDRARKFSRSLEETFALRDDLRLLPDADTIICRCEDVTLGSIEAGDSLRHAKLMTRAGMGSCQGRICGAAITFLRGPSGDTRRPPAFPVTVQVLRDQCRAVPSMKGS